MGRIPRSSSDTNRNISKNDKRIKAETENLFKTKGELKPSKHLSKAQKQLFNFVVSELLTLDVLGTLDVFMLEQLVIAVDRLQTIEKLLNDDINLLQDRNLMAAKEKYSKDLFKCCQELCLSPTSRAKMGNIAVNQKKEQADPLLRLLSGD